MDREPTPPAENADLGSGNQPPPETAPRVEASSPGDGKIPLPQPEKPSKQQLVSNLRLLSSAYVSKLLTFQEEFVNSRAWLEESLKDEPETLAQVRAALETAEARFKTATRHVVAALAMLVKE